MWFARNVNTLLDPDWQSGRDFTGGDFVPLFFLTGLNYFLTGWSTSERFGGGKVLNKPLPILARTSIVSAV